MSNKLNRRILAGAVISLIALGSGLGVANATTGNASTAKPAASAAIAKVKEETNPMDKGQDKVEAKASASPSANKSHKNVAKPKPAKVMPKVSAKTTPKASPMKTK